MTRVRRRGPPAAAAWPSARARAGEKAATTPARRGTKPASGGAKGDPAVSLVVLSIVLSIALSLALAALLARSLLVLLLRALPGRR